jgi:hypothetical protein
MLNLVVSLDLGLNIKSECNFSSTYVYFNCSQIFTKLNEFLQASAFSEFILYIFEFLNLRFSIPDSVVGIATSYRLEDRGGWVRIPVRSTVFSTSTQPPIQWV